MSSAVALQVRAKKQLRHVLQQNKDLACALEAARARILQLESGKERHDKVYGLCLPQIKAWTEDNVKQVHTILENSLRSIRLVADILTPSQDLTLAEDGDDTGQELLQRSLHPPGSRLVGCPDLMDVEEEEEEGETDVAEDGAAQETQIPLSSKVTVRSRRRRYSSPPPETSDEEAAVSPPRLRMSSYASSVGAVQTPPVFQHSGSVCLPDEEADERISVAGRATTASPLRELDVNEYTMIFGSRPKIARTPERGGSPSRRPEPLPPPRIRMFDCQSSSKQTTSKGGTAAARKQKTRKLSLPKVRRSRTTRPASPPAAGAEGCPANGKGSLLKGRHPATNENEEATPSETSVPNPLGPPASPPLPKDAPEPVQPATPSLACRRSSRVQKLPGGTGESGWADDVDAVEVVPPTRRSRLKGSTAHRAVSSVCLPDEEADERISVAGRATTASPLRELDVNEYTMIFGSRPKIARTPERGGSPSRRPEPLPPPRIRMFDCQSSSKQTTSKGGTAAARKQKTRKLSLPKVRRSRTTRPASPPAAGAEGCPANGKGSLLKGRHPATNENEEATPSETSVPNPLGPPVPASPPLPKDAPEPVRPAKPSLACRRSSRVQKLPGGTGESGWADDVDAVEVVPPTRRSRLKGSTAHRASLPSKNRLTFVVPNQVPAGSRRSSSGRPTVPPVETPPADSPPAATGRGASRRSSGAGISRKAQQEEQQRGKRDLEDPELLQPATPSPVRSSSQGARLEGAGEVEWVDEAPEDGPPTRSLEGSAAGKAPKSCRSTFFLPKPAGLGSLEGPKATPVEAPDRDLLSVLTVQGTPGHSSGHFRKSRERLQKRKSAKSSIGIREAAFLAEEAETTGSQYCTSVPPSATAATDEDDGAARSGHTRRRRKVTSYKEPRVNRKMRRS
ncbi:nascent polypeptide-associated complex subunit alpha, muscle-specific form [Ixodes scapularis]